MRLDGPEGLAEPRRDLRLGETLEVGEQERLALRVRQVNQRASHGGALLGAREIQVGILGGGGLGALDIGGARPLAERLGSDAIERAAAGEERHPREHAPPLLVEIASALPDLQEGVLENVLGLVADTDDTQRDPEKDVSVAIVERCERSAVTAGRGPQEGDVFGVVGCVSLTQSADFRAGKGGDRPRKAPFITGGAG